jgi:hypothetical protein
MKKIILSVAALAGTVALTAAEVPKVEDKALFSGGEVSGQIKAMHILGDKTNKWAPENGSGYLGTLKYVTPDLWTKGLKAGAALYVNGDTGATEWNDANDKPAQGLFTDVEGKTNTLLGEAYLEYKSSMIDVTVGRQILNTPLTTIQWSLMPNFYQAAVATVKPVSGLSITALHIDKMAYGSRTATDWSLIGEKTGTAGVTTGAVGQVSESREQARFLNLGTAAGVGKETNGMSAASITYKAGKNFNISIWDYIVHDIANNIYADAMYQLPVMKGTNLTLQAQYLKQSGSGDKLAGDLDFSMYGAKAKIGNKKWSAFVAYNASNDQAVSTTLTGTTTRFTGGFFNAWGADPAYTSSIFSRNAYRQDVSAYKIGAHYVIMKGLKVMASHADYGKSKTTAPGVANGGIATNDATETDIVLVYKPTKAVMLKLFNAIRTSEYSDGTTLGRKQNHVRAIASYTF